MEARAKSQLLHMACHSSSGSHACRRDMPVPIASVGTGLMSSRSSGESGAYRPMIRASGAAGVTRSAHDESDRLCRRDRTGPRHDPYSDVKRCLLRWTTTVATDLQGSSDRNRSPGSRFGIRRRLRVLPELAGHANRKPRLQVRTSGTALWHRTSGARSSTGRSAIATQLDARTCNPFRPVCARSRGLPTRIYARAVIEGGLTVLPYGPRDVNCCF